MHLQLQAIRVITDLTLFDCRVIFVVYYSDINKIKDQNRETLKIQNGGPDSMIKSKRGKSVVESFEI